MFEYVILMVMSNAQFQKDALKNAQTVMNGRFGNGTRLMTRGADCNLRCPEPDRSLEAFYILIQYLRVVHTVEPWCIVLAWIRARPGAEQTPGIYGRTIENAPMIQRRESRIHKINNSSPPPHNSEHV